ncbi:MAG: AAA family ATPase, partial [Acidobacteriota bacterium]
MRDEARRVVTAREPSAFEYLQMLPAERHSLERLTVRVDRRDQVAVAADLARQERERRAHEVLVSVARPWHEDERAADRPPVVGRADDVARLAAMLSGKERRSVLLVGPELCGKTSVLRAWHDAERKARRLPRVYATSGVELLAGMSGFGQWQERVKRVMEAAEVLDAILYFDDLGDLFTDRTSSVVDMATQMKPYVEEDRVRVVAEVTPDVLSANDARHAGFLGAFLRVVVDPMSSSATASVLAARSAHRRRAQPDRLTLEDDALPVLLELVDRYEPYDAHPGKAVRLLDDVHASHADVVSYGARTLGAHEVHATFSLKTGIPLFLLRQDEPLHVGDVEQALRRRLVGQDRAVRRVAETVCVVKATLQPPGKPLAALLFTGPTGVGKTELARCLARYLFGSEERMLRFDMSEYQDPFAAQRLIRGTDRQDGLLTRRVRQQPFSVLLLDEIEKAHPAVFDLLLQVLGEGRLTDARGRTAFFHNAIVIMTSNLGGRRRRPVGLADAPASSESHDRRHVEELFRPELVNRIDRIVPFEALGASDVRTVAGMLVGDVALRRGFADLGIALEVSEAALGVLAQEGASPRYGARAMRRTIEDRVVAPLARLLAPLGSRALGATARVTIAGEAGGGDDAVASSVEENLRFEIAGAERSARREVKSIHDVAALRREVDGWMALPRCTEVKERLDVVVADLARLRKKKGKKEAEMPARERTALMTEHRRLEHVWSAARAAREEICSVEELALALALSGEDVASFAPDAIAAHRRFRRELLRLLTVMAPGCDSVTLMLVDVDGQEAFARWLALLLDEIAIRRFAVTLHVDGGERLARETWPPLSERR